MAPKFDDLKFILPEQITRNVTGRKLQIAVIATIVTLVIICVVLGALVGLHAGGQMGPGTGGGNSAAAITGGSGEYLPIPLKACVTTECLETAARMSENMDKSVDPCNDFFQYACGSWGKRHSIPPNRPDYTVNRKLNDENLEKLRELIETPVKRSGEASSERKLKEFFEMCLHDYGRMQDAGADLIDLIRRHLKGWYALDPDNWQSNGWNLNDAISDVQGELNVDVLFSLSVQLDWATQQGMIRISQGGTSMYHYNYLREDRAAVQDAYKDYMRAVGALLIRDANITLDGSELERRVEQFVDDAYSQETKLAELAQRGRRPPYSGRVRSATIADLERNFTLLPWREMTRRAYEGFEIADDTLVKVWPFGYFQLVNELLVNETTNRDRWGNKTQWGRRIMNNYMVWQLAAEYSRYLSWEYKYASYRYYEQAYGRTEFPAAWEECMAMTKSRMGSALAAEFLSAHSDLDTKQEVDTMYTYIRNALNNSIEHFKWMDDETKQRAIEKVASINRTVGFPDSYFDTNFLDELHSKLVINKTDGFFKTFLNVQEFQRYMRGLEIRAGQQYYMWRFALSGGAGGTNPSYFWRSNYLIVPPGSLQSPLYVRGNPNFMNFAGIGRAVADELGTAIDELGRNIWGNGSWVNWWSQDTYSDYLKAKSCFSNYFEGMKLGPYLIDGENQTVILSGNRQSRRIIDLVAGIRTGLKAYHDWSATHGGDTMPIGLKMTTDQAYFVSAAQTQCYIRTPEAAYTYARYQYPPEEVM